MPDLFSAFKKASFWAPFAFLGAVLGSGQSFAEKTLCDIQRIDEVVKVDKVYDGDTLKLEDGRKLRLIGINTPERGKEGKADEPYFEEAREKLSQLILKTNNTIKIQHGIHPRDRYGRLLAHIFTSKEQNITQTLLGYGMGYAIHISPNTLFNKCYNAAEQVARSKKYGLWNKTHQAVVNVAGLKQDARGFHLVSGKVIRFGESRSSFWLNLSKNFALRILKKDNVYFKQYSPKSLVGQHIIVRGWIYKRNNELRIRIRHPDSIEIHSTD